MIRPTDYTNCKLIIRNEVTGENVAESKILEYQKGQYSIFVDASQFIDKLFPDRLSLLIFTHDSIHEFGGMARKSYSPNRVEISMFRGKEREEREAKRYSTNIGAIISNITSAEGVSITKNIVSVKVLNLSTLGALMHVGNDNVKLEIGMRFTLRLNIAEETTCVKCEVIRHLARSEDGARVYGCKFISVENG